MLQIPEVAYEDTVSGLERQARRLLDFVGLPWDDRVLQFHQSDRAVQTPSRWQVREPLYQTSKARWRRYEHHLAPLIVAAGLGAPDFYDAEVARHNRQFPASNS